MRGALGFVGMFLSVLSDAGRGHSITNDCGNKFEMCPVYCAYCDEKLNQGLSRRLCYEHLFLDVCYVHFEEALNKSSDLCAWDDVKGKYSNFSQCTERIADCLLIPWPNPFMERTFVEIHSLFFHQCPTEGLRDPPPSIVFALVMTPICLIPAMVVLVVLKTKNGDGSS